MARMSLAFIAARVAERIFRGSDRWDGKHVGKDCRLQWSQHTWFLEELPQKGKKKLKSATLQNPSGYGYFDAWIAGNILRTAKLTSSDDFGSIKKKVLAAYEQAYEYTKSSKNEKEKALLEKSDWVTNLEWYEKDVFYLHVVPEGTDAFTADGKDFSMKVEWDKFKTYSPNSDFQQSDPHYSLYESSSPTAARKLYVMLKANPTALKTLSWSGLGDWLTKNKVQYKIHHSQWS
jgi:hypothetical protein